MGRAMYLALTNSLCYCAFVLHVYITCRMYEFSSIVLRVSWSVVIGTRRYICNALACGRSSIYNCKTSLK